MSNRFQNLLIGYAFLFGVCWAINFQLLIYVALVSLCALIEYKFKD